MSRKALTQSDVMETIITRDLRVKGDISSEGDIYIDGHVEGDVASHGQLRIGQSGVVHGNLWGQDIRIEGTVVGDITAVNGISCSDSAHITGALNTRDLDMARGAYFSGQVQMQRETTPVELEADEAE